MWDLGNIWGEGKSTPMASYLTVMHEIHVLLVDHEPECLINTAKMLEMCQYRVTLVELASAAITMLASGKVKFDVILANINSPDLHGFKLLQHAVSLEIPIILMSVDDNMFMATRAIENGAYMYIKKPPSMEMLRCIWQHVLKEKMRLMRERESLMTLGYGGSKGIEFREVIPANGEENPNGIDEGNMMKDKDKSKKKIRARNGASEEEYSGLENHTLINNRVKRKVCTEWTQKLHEKFINAVEQLGEGRCFPKEILELMNVPGLTRMQVASHLQKCRNDNWRSPEERKSSTNLSVQPPASSDSDGSHQRPRRFGSMPRLTKGRPNHVQAQETGGDHAPRPQSHGNGGGAEMMMRTGNIMTSNNLTSLQYQNFGSLLMSHLSHGASSSNPRPPSADLVSLQEVECLLQNFSSVPQASAAMMNNPNFAPGAYLFNPFYLQQNSAVQCVETRSQWSSDQTSNFGSDESENRRH